MVGEFHRVDSPDFPAQTLKRENRRTVTRVTVNYMGLYGKNRQNRPLKVNNYFQYNVTGEKHKALRCLIENLTWYTVKKYRVSRYVLGWPVSVFTRDI